MDDIDTTATNAAEIAFWNAEPGQKWSASAPDMDQLFSSVMDLILTTARASPGQAVLDIGCGSGATSIAMAREVGPDGRVLGLDVSQPLLERAGQRRDDAGLSNLHFVRDDAQTHDFEGEAFDMAISRFGVMFFADTVAAFHNISSALKPGGRMCLAAWAHPEHNPWFSLPRQVATDLLGDVPPTPLNEPGPFAFHDLDRVTAMMREAGLMDVVGRSRELTLHHDGGSEALSYLGTNVGPVSRILVEKEATRAQRSEIRAGVKSALEPYTTPNGVSIPAVINLFIARRA